MRHILRHRHHQLPCSAGFGLHAVTMSDELSLEDDGARFKTPCEGRRRAEWLAILDVISDQRLCRLLICFIFLFLRQKRRKRQRRKKKNMIVLAVLSRIKDKSNGQLIASRSRMDHSPHTIMIITCFINPYTAGICSNTDWDISTGRSNLPSIWKLFNITI